MMKSRKKKAAKKSAKKESKDSRKGSKKGSKKGGGLKGKKLCISGTLNMPRKEIISKIEAAGGKVVAKISGNVDILVAGEKTGSKVDEAEGMGITIWSEEDLVAAL